MLGIKDGRGDGGDTFIPGGGDFGCIVTIVVGLLIYGLVSLIRGCH